MRPIAFPRAALATAPLLFLFACAQGGKQTLPDSAVKIAANHHLIWFRSLVGFGSVATRAEAVASGHGLLSLDLDSNYTLQDSTGSSTDRYSIADDGAMSIIVTGTGRNPSSVFPGAYRLVGTEPDLFFTDLIASGATNPVGMYVGTRVHTGQVELGGFWHVLSMHVILTTNSPTLPRQIGRAAHGLIEIAAGAPGTLRSITNANVGTSGEVRGTESGNDLNPITVDFGGTIQNVLDGTGTGDGTCILSLEYNNVGSPIDPRDCYAVAGHDIVLALDDQESDGETGLVMLVRAFDTPANPATAALVAGEYQIGGYTLFVNPANNGSDAFLGTLTLTAQGGFTLDATGHQGIDFRYTGNFTIDPNGRLALTVNSTNEHWTAAVNREANTIVLVDDVVENRTNNLPELNLVFGVRRKIN